jgi:hypothetical protein
MRVYFHLRTEHSSIPDVQGVEVTDLEQARADAFELLCELHQQDACAGVDSSGWTLEAADRTGRVVFSLNLNRIASVAQSVTRPSGNSRRAYDHRAHLRLLQKARKLAGPTP